MDQPRRTLQRPTLITPQGTTIDLPPELYQTILQMLATDQPRSSQSRKEKLALIHGAFGRYRGHPSLTGALLEERGIERAREEAERR